MHEESGARCGKVAWCVASTNNGVSKLLAWQFPNIGVLELKATSGAMRLLQGHACVAAGEW